MEEEVLNNQDLTDFLQKYDQNDWNMVISKLSKIGLLSLEKDQPKKDFYTFDDFDNIILDLEQKIIKEDEKSKNENIKDDNLNIEDLNDLKEPDDNEEKEINKEELINEENLNEKPIEITDNKPLEKLEDKIIDKETPNLEKKNDIGNSSIPNSSPFNKYSTFKDLSSNYNPKGSYSNINYRNNNFNNNEYSMINPNNDKYDCNNLNNNYYNYNIQNYRLRSYNYGRNDYPCLNYNYSTSSPKIKNDKEFDPCCNKSTDFYNSYSSFRYNNAYC